MDISGRRVAGWYAGAVAGAAAFVLVVIPAIGGPGVWAEDVEPSAPVAAVSEVAQVEALRSVLGDVAVVCVDAPTSTCVPGRMEFGRIVLSEVTSDDPVAHELVARPVRDLLAFEWTSTGSDGCECLYPPLIVSV